MAQLITYLALAATCASAADVCDARTGCVDEFSALQRSAAPDLYVQRLTNYKDIEYTTHITIGQQTFRAVVDTGSHELMVVSSRCLSTTCLTARQHYKGDKDTGYKTFNFNQHHQYGAAALNDKLSKDQVHVGELASNEQYFWEIVAAPGMKDLTEGTFEAILGLGNPYHAAMEAAEWKHLDEMEWEQEGCKDLKKVAPNTTCSDIDDRIDFHSFAVKSHAEHPPAVLPGLGVKIFSVCFGVYSGSDGVLRWNDINPTEQTGFFSHLNVVGRSDWSVPLTSPKLSGVDKELSLGCEKGEKCEVIFDTGSSIIMAPSEVVNALVDTLNNFTENGLLDCANLNEFPDLLLTLDGHQVRIPPEAYIGEVVGTSDETVEEQIEQLRNLREDAAPMPGWRRVQQASQPLPQDVGAQVVGSALKAAQPVPQQAAQPVLQQAAQPVLQQAAQPVLQQAAQPVPQQAAQPVPQQAAQPVPQQAAQPVPQQAAQPVLQQAAQPVRPKAPEPLQAAHDVRAANIKVLQKATELEKAGKGVRPTSSKDWTVSKHTNPKASAKPAPKPAYAPGMDYHKTAATGTASSFGRSGSGPGRVPGQSHFTQSYNKMTYGRATRRPRRNQPFYFKGHKMSNAEMDELTDKFDAGMRRREDVKKVKLDVGAVKEHKKQKLQTEEQAKLKALREEAARIAAQPQCRLLMMANDMGTDTSDKAWVLGMPFFRHFFTTFEAEGDDYSKRKVHIAPNDGKCNHPFEKHYMSLRKERNAGSRVTTVDFSKIRMPRVYFDDEEADEHAEDDAEEAE